MRITVPIYITFEPHDETMPDAEFVAKCHDYAKDYIKVLTEVGPLHDLMAPASMTVGIPTVCNGTDARRI